ncbi:MAG: hypothetical protein QG671_3515 [Actinomycetota bacterium]|nr:hypothetical protein [Actinomycetota bacterium]
MTGHGPRDPSGDDIGDPEAQRQPPRQDGVLEPEPHEQGPPLPPHEDEDLIADQQNPLVNDARQDVRIAHSQDIQVGDGNVQVIIHAGDGPSSAAQNRGPVFAVPPPRPGDVPRPGLIQRLVDHLSALDGPEPARPTVDAGASVVAMTTGLAGAGGFGKTTLVRMLVHHAEVRDRFPDGILWVTLGDQLTGAELADRIDDASAALTGVKPPHTDPLLAGAALGEALGPRRMLLVLDDAWDRRQVEPFLSGGPSTVRLVTTRQHSVLPDGSVRVDVDAMTDDEAAQLLATDLQELPAPVVADVLRVTGRWPLLLSLVNGAARADHTAGATPAQALGDVRDQLVTAGLTALDVTVATDRNSAVSATLQVSLDRLSPEEQSRYLELAVFGEDIGVPLTVLARYWKQTGDKTPAWCRTFTRRLADLSLLASYRLDTPPGPRVRLHAVIRAYLRTRLDKGRQRRLAETVVDALTADMALPMRADNPTSAWWGFDEDVRDYAERHLVRHLLESGQPAHAEAVACNIGWAVHRLPRVGITGLLSDLALVRTRRAQELSSFLGRVAHMLAEDRPATAEFLLNALRGEPQWAQESEAVDARRPGTRLVTRWIFPDNASPALRHVLKIPTGWGQSNAMAVSPQGAWLVVMTNAGLAVVDTTTREVGAIYPCDQQVRRISISPDGQRIATVGGGSVAVRDAGSGRGIWHYSEPGILWSAIFTPDSSKVITTGNDGLIKMWDASTGARLPEDPWEAFSRWCPDPPSDRPSIDAVVTADGSKVVSAGYGVYLWSLPDGLPLQAYGARSHLMRRLTYHVAAAPDASWVAGSSKDGLEVWDTGTGRLITTLGDAGPARFITVSADGRRLAAGRSDGEALVWDATHDFALIARLGGQEGLAALAFSPNGELLYASGGGEVRIWEPSQARSSDSLGLSRPVDSAHVFPDASMAALSVQGGEVHLREIATGKLHATLAHEEDTPPKVAIAPNGEWLATEQHGKLSVWTRQGSSITAFDVSSTTGAIRQIRVSADSEVLFTVDDLAVRAWDVNSGVSLTTMATFMRDVSSLAFSPDGTWLAAGDYYGTIWIWDTASGTLRTTMGGEYLGAPIKALSAPNSDEILAFCGSDLERWDINQGRRTSRSGTSLHHPPHVALSRESTLISTHEPVALSGDGRWFISADHGPTISTEETACGDSTGHTPHPTPHRLDRDHYGWALALSDNGELLATISNEEIIVYETSRDSIVATFPSSWTAPTPLGMSLALSTEQLAHAINDDVRILSFATKKASRLPANLGVIREAAFSPDGQYAAALTDEGVRVWHTQTRQTLPSPQLDERPTALAFTPSGTSICIAEPTRVRVFDLPTVRPQATAALPDGIGLQQIAATLDDARLVLLTDPSHLVVLSIDDTLASYAVPLDEDGIFEHWPPRLLSVSPDGRLVALAGPTLSVRRLDDGALLAMHNMNRTVTSLAWTPDSTSIVVGSEGGAYCFLLSRSAD